MAPNKTSTTATKPEAQVEQKKETETQPNLPKPNKLTVQLSGSQDSVDTYKAFEDTLPFKKMEVAEFMQKIGEAEKKSGA